MTNNNNTIKLLGPNLDIRVHVIKVNSSTRGRCDMGLKRRRCRSAIRVRKKMLDQEHEHTLWSMTMVVYVCTLRVGWAKPKSCLCKWWRVVRRSWERTIQTR